MSHNTIQKHSIQKRKSPAQELDSQRKLLSDKEKELAALKESLGYGHLTVGEFLALEPDVDNEPENAVQMLELQEEYGIFLGEQEQLKEIIFVEPAKLHETVNAAEQLLITHRKYNVYQRAGRLVRIVTVDVSSQSKKDIIKRRHDAVVIKEIDQVYLTLLLTTLGNFKRLDKRTADIASIDCPERIARSLLAKHEWELPILTGIINAPTLRSDGSILDNPGYDALSGMLFIPGEYEFEKIPEQPTLEDAQEAKKKLLYILKEFPFEDDVGASVFFAALLTALIRKSIPAAPLFGFTAPKMASGKSLLADMIALIATGKANSPIAQADSEVEEKKRLMAVLNEGDPIVCYDNIEKPFGSAALCIILTQDEYKDRILGVSQTRTVPTNATFLATGNNLTFMGDITTRTLLCRLDPGVERPEERLFDLNLRIYIPENRGGLVQAALTILYAYHIAGRPKQNIKPFGRFEEWDAWVRSAIIWIGMADPYESRKEIENADPIRILLGSLFAAWYEIFGAQGIKVKELIAKVTLSTDTTHETFKENLIELAPDTKSGINVRVLAKKLATFKKRIENGYRLEQMDIHQGTVRWQVKKVNT